MMDWLCRSAASGRLIHNGPPLTVHTLLVSTIKAYEVQGCFLLRNAFNTAGLDHTILVKLASTAVVSWCLGLTKPQTMAAISQVWMDTAPLHVYRAGHNTIPRKGWAAGDAYMRAVYFALLTQKGQAGSPTPLTMPRWGFYATTWQNGRPFQFPKPYTTWVIENIFYKVMPVEGHGIAAVEASIVQSKKLKARELDPAVDIASIEIRTCAAANLIINKKGSLYNAADRDHCMQYVVAVALLKGTAPVATDFEDDSTFASSPDVVALREKIHIPQDDDLTKDYLDLEKKSIPSGVTTHLNSGDVLSEVLVEFPLGHMENKGTATMVRDKFNTNMALMFSEEEIKGVENSLRQGSNVSISAFVDQLARVGAPKL
jgi:2-methylcitrate dehydratase